MNNGTSLLEWLVWRAWLLALAVALRALRGGDRRKSPLMWRATCLEKS